MRNFIGCNSDPILPGHPRKTLVRDVKRSLWRAGIRPVRNEVWTATWEWAAQIANSYLMIRELWPDSQQIAAQYVLLLLAEMRDRSMLKLPFKANEQMPASVAKMLPDRRDRLALTVEVA